MYILLFIVFLIIAYSFVQIVDADVFPLCYGRNSERNVNTVIFSTYVSPNKK